MTKKYKPLPIGTEDLKKIIQNDAYYVDKTLLIKELLDNKSDVTLFTRPRRFGKTLNMSMLKYFFEDTWDEALNAENHAIFENLKIMDAGEEYTEQMQQYPVISLTLKSAKQDIFEDAYFKMKTEILYEFKRHRRILESDRLLDSEKELYRRLMDGTAGLAEYSGALKFLSECIFSATGQKCIILIDEYDVPLENAYFHGFYDRMISFIRSLFESALKTNDHLQFAVITGCLRISKESIFTGLNNLRIVSILNKDYGEYFGFTPQEVETMASYYDVEERMDDIRRWYDGYLFGNSEVYNPWSVVNFMADLRTDKSAFVRPYWANTSSNEIVRDLIRHADSTAREELETLIAGGTLKKPLHEDITYGEINENQDNLWNFLFFTGYLKSLSTEIDKRRIFAELTIPNDEVLSIYEEKISEWFDETVTSRSFDRLYEATEIGDTEVMEEELCDVLLETISYFDHLEAFYHGFLAGIYQHMGKYSVQSNPEVGAGRPDLALVPPRIRGRYFLFEFKIVKEQKDLKIGCAEALNQIREKKYVEGAHARGYENVCAYGVAFCGKECIVQKYEE